MVRVMAWVPDRLTSEEKKLFQDLDKTLSSKLPPLGGR